MAKVREKVHEELMSKLFKKNHPYASLERSEENAEADEFLPVVQISSRHQPDLDLSEYYRNWKSVAEPDVIMPEPNPLSPNAMFADVKPMSPVAPFRATVTGSAYWVLRRIWKVVIELFTTSYAGKS